MKSRHGYALLYVVVLLSVMVAGCGGKAKPAGNAPSAKDVRLVVRNLPMPQTPYHKVTSADPLMYSLIYDTLLMEDANKGLQPLLADEWSQTDDKLTITFKLNPKATFSNGKPVLATDVEFGFSYLRTGILATTLVEAVACVDKIEVVGEREVRFTLKQVCPEALRDLGTRVAVFNKAANINEGGIGLPQIDANLIKGSGPFVYDKKASKEREILVLQATGSHYRLQPIVETVTFVVAANEDATLSPVKVADVYPLIFGSP